MLPRLNPSIQFQLLKTVHKKLSAQRSWGDGFYFSTEMLHYAHYQNLETDNMDQFRFFYSSKQNVRATGGNTRPVLLRDKLNIYDGSNYATI